MKSDVRLFVSVSTKITKIEKLDTIQTLWMTILQQKRAICVSEGEKACSLFSAGKTLSDLKRNIFNLFQKLGYDAGRFEQCYKKIELAKVYKNGGFNFPGSSHADGGSHLKLCRNQWSSPI